MSVIFKKNDTLAYKVYGPLPNTPKVDKLKIDKLAITLDIPNEFERKSIDKQLLAMKEHDYATWDWKMKYKHTKRL